LGVVAALIAFISSVVSLVQVNKSGDKGKGMAVTGLLLSILFFVGAFTMSAIFVFASIGVFDH
jgi:amino acid permease